MLLEHLYRISLEEPKYWGLFFGTTIDTDGKLTVRIDLLYSYMSGFRSAKPDDDEARHFFDWLYRKNEFPTKGWPRKYLDDSGGNHLRAIEKFWRLLHEYLFGREATMVYRD